MRISLRVSRKRFGWVRCDCQQVSTRDDFSNQLRTFAHVSPNQEKCRLSVCVPLEKDPSSLGVIAGFGPSSKVMASLRGEAVRQIVCPKSCARDVLPHRR